MISDREDLREKTGVFADRKEAGEVLAGLVAPLGENPLLLAVPAGGVPVAVSLAERLRWPLDVAVVSKITLPWNAEAGYGAVAFDGTVRLNEKLLPVLGLSDGEIKRGIAAAQKKVRRRVKLFRDERAFPDLSGRTAVLVDDGLASGFTLHAAVEAVRRLGAAALVIAVPTGYRPAVETIEAEVTAVCCANVRSGATFAVASAYREWSDVPEEEALALLSRRRGE